MSKGTLRPLFQAAMPKNGDKEMGDFLVVEATPKPDGKNGHRYWGVVVQPDSSNNPGSSDNPWVIPLHADVDYPSSPAGVTPDGPLMVLSFRQCPALEAA